MLYQFPHDGFYEVLLEFSLAGEPARVYQPEDWRIWVGKPRPLDIRTWAWAAAVTSTLLTMVVVISLRRQRPERGGER